MTVSTTISPARVLIMRVHLVRLMLFAATATVTAVPSVLSASSAAMVEAPVPALYIVQSTSMNAALRNVQKIGARVQQRLAIIAAVTAYLTPAQVKSLGTVANVRVFEDRQLKASGTLTSLLNSTTNSINSTLASTSLVATTSQLTTPVVSTVVTNAIVSSLTSPIVASMSSQAGLQDGTGVDALTLTYQTNYPALDGADSLQRAGVTGKGVTIAVLDTGLWNDLSQNYGARLLASIDVVNGGTGRVTGDPYGHGTHVTSIAASGAQNLAGGYLGIAPSANLVVVRAFDGNGGGRYTDVIAGINWIVANRTKYKIRVLNLSFGAAPESYYWDDPLNQAVMAAWRAGIG